jgi:hypothetical protein
MMSGLSGCRLMVLISLEMHELYSFSQSRPIFPEEDLHRYRSPGPTSPRKRTTILDLPNELLLVTFAYFSHCPDTLRDIAIARREFTDAAKAVFFSTIRILVRGVDAERACGTLLAAVRKSANAKGSSGEALMAPLRNLELDFSGAPECGLSPLLGDLVPQLPVLEEVTIRVTDLAKCAPADLETAHSALPDFTAMMKILESWHGKSTPKALPIQVLMTTCRSDTMLQFVKYWSGTVLQRHQVNTCDRWDVAEQLTFAQQCLTHLTVLENRWRDAPQPPVDFSGFERLSRLTIPAGLWFEQAALGNSHDRTPKAFVWKMADARLSVMHLLPPSVQKLQVDFRSPAAVFAVGIGYVSMPKIYFTLPNQVLQMRVAYAWILELAEAKAGRLRSLEVVRVLEHPDGHLESLMEDWSMPQELQQTFADADVELEVQLRHIARPYRNGKDYLTRVKT